MRSVVVYASKYGSTAEYARLIAEKLDTVALRASETLSGEVARADLIVIGSPVYGPGTLPEMDQFLRRNRGALEGKPLAAFVVCGDTVWIPRAGEGGGANLDKLLRLLPSPPVATAVLGGRLVVDDLDEVDRERILAFYRRLGRDPAGFDHVALADVDPFVEAIKQGLESGV